MSGGRFNYINDDLFREIYGWSAEYERYVPDVFEDLEISNLIHDVFKLIHDYDWYVSGDTCEETYIQAKTAFKEKWLNNRELRVQRIVDEAIAKTKDDLYRTYNITEERQE